MIIAAILLGICQIIGFIGFGWLLRMYFERKQAQIERRIDATLHEWFTPEAEGEPHKAARALAAMGEVVGAAAARSIMASIAADRSHLSRQVNGALDEAQGAQNPILGLLSGGKRGKGAALAQLAAALGPMLAGHGGGGHNGGSNSNEKSVRDRLQHHT